MEFEVWREPAYGQAYGQAVILKIAPLFSITTPYNCSDHAGEASGLVIPHVLHKLQRIGFQIPAWLWWAKMLWTDKTIVTRVMQSPNQIRHTDFAGSRKDFFEVIPESDLVAQVGKMDTVLKIHHDIGHIIPSQGSTWTESDAEDPIGNLVAHLL